MLISDIVPYGHNARNNVKAIPKVAESIKEFGLRGTIGLESRENPVIVFGHTRVAACKSLGWTEIPDSKIEFCDDLTPEQVKAFRIADNKTGDIATYNKSVMGGRGATSYYYKFDGEGHIYGDEYGSVIHGFDNVKIIASKKNKPKKAPAESRTPWRVYATVDKETGLLHSITFMDGDGKRYKTIDAQDHKGMGSHSHDGYNHDSDPRKLSRKERRQLAEVRSYIRKYGGKG